MSNHYQQYLDLHSVNTSLNISNRIICAGTSSYDRLNKLKYTNAIFRQLDRKVYNYPHYLR